MLAEFIYFCWRCSSNVLKQDNQATILLGSSIWIPYFLLALPAMNISTMEWRSFLAASWVFTLSLSRCFSIELKQDNQATIHHGSARWIPYVGLETNSVRRFLWCSCSVCSRLLSFFFFFFNHAPRVFSQWTRTGKPTNDFSWLFNVNLPPQLGPSREDLFIWVEATFIIYKIHSMIHCCSTLNSFFCQTEIENQSHRKFISHVNKLIIWKLSNVLSKAAFNVETVNVKTLYQLHSSYFR